jgi:hypothetical protein
MRQTRRDPSLATESRQELRIGGNRVREDLDGDRTLENLVAR